MPSLVGFPYFTPLKRWNETFVWIAFKFYRTVLQNTRCFQGVLQGGRFNSRGPNPKNPQKLSLHKIQKMQWIRCFCRFWLFAKLLNIFQELSRFPEVVSTSYQPYANTWFHSQRNYLKVTYKTAGSKIVSAYST